jgi:hypothetical protein
MLRFRDTFLLVIEPDPGFSNRLLDKRLPGAACKRTVRALAMLLYPNSVLTHTGNFYKKR